MKLHYSIFLLALLSAGIQPANAQKQPADTIPAKNIILQNEEKGNDKTAEEIKKKELTITPSPIILKDLPKQPAKKKTRCSHKKKKS